ncbi:MAG: Lrp/AsnC family transcriptional regulator, partial [Brevibacterium aurantiacum]
MSQKVELDDVDRQLLKALSEDARASGTALASMVGISESTVSLRLKRLKTVGVRGGVRVER